MMKLNLLSVLIITFFITSPLLKAQTDIPAASNGDIKFYVDQTYFAGKENKTLIEFYFMIYADQLELEVKNDSSYASYNVNLKIKNSNSQMVVDKEWMTEALINNNLSDLKSLAIYDQYTETLSSGDYKIFVEIKDQNNSSKGSVEYSLNVLSINNDFSSSQFQFASQITEDKKGQFNKGDYSIIPNPSRRYGILNPILYFYYELYNIPGSEDLKITYSLSSKEGKIIKTYPETVLKKHSHSATLIQGLNVSQMKTGVYELNADIESKTNKEKVSLARNIEIIQMDYLDSKPVLSKDESDEAGKLIKYIATNDQNNLFEKLNANAKAQFLINFWKNLDPTPGTIENEYLNKIKQRYNYANENFGWAGVEGWSTDRGRVIIKYGMPDDIDRHYYTPENLPFEIWKYQTSRNYVFVFVDLRSIGRFDLVHSNMEGEVHNSNWQEDLKQF